LINSSKNTSAANVITGNGFTITNNKLQFNDSVAQAIIDTAKAVDVLTGTNRNNAFFDRDALINAVAFGQGGSVDVYTRVEANQNTTQNITKQSGVVDGNWNLGLFESSESTLANSNSLFLRMVALLESSTQVFNTVTKPDLISEHSGVTVVRTGNNVDITLYASFIYRSGFWVQGSDPRISYGDAAINAIETMMSGTFGIYEVITRVISDDPNRKNYPDLIPIYFRDEKGSSEVSNPLRNTQPISLSNPGIIHLYSTRSNSDTPVGLNEFQNIVVHEVLHLFGIGGHPDLGNSAQLMWVHRDDIMYQHPERLPNPQIYEYHITMILAAHESGIRQVYSSVNTTAPQAR